MRVLRTVSLLLLVPSLLLAQKKSKDQLAGYDRSARATILHTANVYPSADDTAKPFSEVTPGHEVIIVDHNGPWMRVFANTDIPDQRSDEPEFTEDAPPPISGWVHDKGIVTPATPGGDAILYGAAANFEAEAAEPHAPKGADQAAKLLYRRVFEYFPDSALAPQAAFRSADIRWQLDKLDLSTLPSAKEQDAYLRPQIYEADLKKVIKNYPNTKYSALAAFDLLDNKLCGDWQGLPRCPEMETTVYMKYAQQYPGGPKSAEALYNAVYRQGVVVTMYQVQEDRKRSEAAAKNVAALAKQMQTDYPDSDYTARATSIAFRVSQGISIYGTDRD